MITVSPTLRQNRRAPVTMPRDLERTIEAVRQLQGRSVRSVVIRNDCRQVRITLDDERMLLLSVQTTRDGKPRLDADLVDPAQSADID